MFAILGSIFLFLLSLIYYNIITLNSNILIQQTIQLRNIQSIKITKQKYLYATCIDKQKLSIQNLAQLQLKSQLSQLYVTIFDEKPQLDCQQLLENIYFELEKFNNNQGKNSIKYKDQQKAKTLPQIGQTIKLENQICKQIQDSKPFLILSTILEKKLSNNHSTSQISPSTAQQSILLRFLSQNFQLSKQILRSVFWFSWFNLISISLVSYYRKNVFNTKKIRIQISIIILASLLLISIINHSFIKVQQFIELLILGYVLSIFIKNSVDVGNILLGLVLFYMNQIIDQFYDLSVYVSFGITLMTLFHNIQSIYKNGQTKEIKTYSLINITGLILIQNKNLIDNGQQFISIIYIVVMMFGTTILEVFQLRKDYDLYKSKTKVRLQSYQIAENQQFQRN